LRLRNLVRLQIFETFRSQPRQTDLTQDGFDADEAPRSPNASIFPFSRACVMHAPVRYHSQDTPHMNLVPAYYLGSPEHFFH